MLKSGCFARYAAAIALVVGVSSPALAQNLQNAGSIGQRLPGELVSAGIVRQQDRIISPRITPEITQQQAPAVLNPRQQFFVEAIQTIFDQLNAAILLFTNVLRAQVGATPLLPTTIGSLPPLTQTQTGTTTGSETTPDEGVGTGADGSTTSDPGVADEGGATAIDQADGARGGQRARRSPGHLEARLRLRSAAKSGKR